MTALDWIILAFVAAMALWGYGQGLIVSGMSLLGFAVGAFLGGRLAPAILSQGSESPYAPLIALLGAMLVGGMVAVTMEAVAWGVRTRVVRGRGHGVADGIGGALLLAALGFGVAWVGGAVALHTPGAGNLRQDIQRSTILRRLNAILPPSGPILHALNRIDPRPDVPGPPARVGPPNAAVARDPDVNRAGNSVVRVLGTACGLGVEGSGWVAGPGLVVTNAHVVAGESDTTVTVRDASERLAATAVHYEPRNDLAILRVSGLDAPPLGLVRRPRVGTSAAVLGYPEDGPFHVAAARLGATQEVISQDSYGRGPIRRKMTSLRGQVRSGNSGGPVVDTAGRALTTVFGATTSGSRGGLGVPNAIVSQALAGTLQPTGTGACAH
jgi:hypothetical protein